jgi:hypothetical protein
MRILHRPNINPVVFLVGSEPLDKNNPSLIINGGYKSIVISFNVEHNAVFASDACIPITLFDLGR